MGTKLELHADINNNPLDSSCGPKLVDLEYFGSEVLVENIKRSMLQPQNIDSIKKTILIHEDVFKHQVRELHRLYRVQRMLMDELKIKIDDNNKILDQTGPYQPVTGHSFHGQRSEDNLEHSGSCSGDTPRIRRGFDLERPAEQDFPVVRINGSSEDCTNVELTLTTGCNSTATEREKRESYSDRRGSIAMASSSITTMNQENSSQPHWLLHDLKLG